MMKDLTERRAVYLDDAIEAMANTLWHYPNECYRNLNEYEFAKGLAELGLKSVPSAQPDVPDTNVGNTIYRQAAIDVMCGACSDWCDEGVCKKVSALQKLPPAQQWIPCSERLPEQYGNYLISYRTDDFESDIGTFDPDRINLDTGEWSACDANGFYWVASKGLEVIAWMPLPEPYREDIE